MDVKKIFIILITIVACVIVGALVLNVLLPNVATALVDSVEDMIYNASGMNFDFNKNSNDGHTAGSAANAQDTAKHSSEGAGVTGFEVGQGSEGANP